MHINNNKKNSSLSVNKFAFGYLLLAGKSRKCLIYCTGHKVCVCVCVCKSMYFTIFEGK